MLTTVDVVIVGAAGFQHGIKGLGAHEHGSGVGLGEESGVGRHMEKDGSLLRWRLTGGSTRRDWLGQDGSFARVV